MKTTADRPRTKKTNGCCLQESEVCGGTDQPSRLRTDMRNMLCGQSARTIGCSIALFYMTLEAVELGLGFCWLDWFDPDQVGKILNIPEEYAVVAVAPIGFAAKEGRPSPKKSAEEVIVYNQM